MKTYRPKKLVHQEIEKVHELCRLCLENVQDGLPIFKDDQDVCAAVAMRIMICVGLEMKHDQSLPNMICKTCYEELEKYYKFRRKCQLSYQKLNHHAVAVRLKYKNVNINDTLENMPVSETVVDCGPNNEKQKVKQDEERLPLIDEEPSQVLKNVTEKAPEIEEVQIPVQSTMSPDISTFLSTILMELGILCQEGGLLQHQSISTFELETGDQELVMELVEEDDNIPVNIVEEQSALEIVESEDMVIDDKPHSANTRCGKMPGPWCAQCGRAFSSRSALARHRRAHGAARPHACPAPACGASFKQKAVLQRHMLVHLEVRPHRCSLCNKSFTQRGALTAHARGHAPPHARALALHRCTDCDKVFLYASGLTRHMMTHNGRVYECSTCDKRFKDKSSLMRHLKTVCHKEHADNNDRNTTDITIKPAPAVED